MPRPAATATVARARQPFLQTLDSCNLVVLQLAFWVLGAGVVCGAIWADQSWGRPWGWDPKETFALVTWIVLSNRRARPNRNGRQSMVDGGAIGGRFRRDALQLDRRELFLVGLHSYA